MKLYALFKPEYLYNPRQIRRRLRWSEDCVRRGECLVDLPWGLRLFVDPRELIGNCIARLGVYDLTVSEVLWRLADPGETAVDAGSNIGYTASILARRVGPEGRVCCFEPHPEIYRCLERNVALWGLPVETFPIALSESEGEAVLHIPTYFAGNQGTASLSDTPGIPRVREVTVPTAGLDALAQVPSPIGVMKVDVEGHELRLLRGAQRRLSEGSIRDIVFEDHGRPPTDAMRLLAAHGYSILALARRFSGPRLLPSGQPAPPPTSEAPPNYLATRDMARARQRLAPAGWQVLTAARQSGR